MLESYKEENQKLLAEIKELKQKVAQLESGEGPFSNCFAENNKLFQQAQSIAKIGSWKVNLSTGEVNATPEAYDIYGIKKNRKITLKEIQKYPLPEYRSFLDNALKNLIERNIDYNVTFKIRRKSDKKIRVIQSIAEYNPKDHSIIGTIQDITQQKKSEQELLESEEKFRFLFKKHKAVQLIIDSETGDIADANEAAEKFYGWRIKTLKTKNISEINTLPKPVIKKLLKEVSYSDNMNLEFRHRKADNSICDITSASSAIELNGKKYIHSFIQDNTANKETEHKLKLLSRSVEQSPVLIIITNNKGQIEYVNPAFTDKTGYALNEIIDQTPAILKSGNQSEEFYRDLWGTILAGKNWSGQFLNKKKNGEFYWENAFISPILDDSGNITHFVAVKEDITEKKNANLELQEREANLKAIIENSIDSIWSINQDFKIQYLNEVFKQSFLRTFGIILSKGDNIVEALPKEIRDKWLKRYQKVLSGVRVTFEDKISTKDQLVYIEVSMNPIVLQGEVVGASMFGRDITESKQYEFNLISAKERAIESDRLKSAFLANMSHEIRTPMNGIIGFTSILMQNGLSEEEKEQYLKIIQQSGQRLLDTVNDLVDISKIETGQIKPVYSKVDINEQIHFIYSFFKPQAADKGINLKLSSHISLEESITYSDHQKLDSILTNLVKNAIKYTDQGEIEIGGLRKDSQFHFFVKDSGIGIPQNKQKAVFNRFEQVDFSDTRAFEGSGLGLSIAKAYVEMLGGEIWVESQIARGSTFFFTLPHNKSIPEQ